MKKLLKDKFHFFGFSNGESLGVFLIFSVIVVTTLVNLSISYRKGRDVQRKNDLGGMVDALNKFNEKYGFFPASTQDGKIVGCDVYVENDNFKFNACEWYQEGFMTLELLHGDPQQGDGAYYRYISNGEHFQIFASLESKSEPEYDESVVLRNLNCGNRVCNFGRADGKTPVNVGIE